MHADGSILLLLLLPDLGAAAPAQTALRGALNSYLSAQSTGSCPPLLPLPPTPQYYDFVADKGGSLGLLSTALNTWLGVDGMNDAVAAATKSQVWGGLIP